ncbi:MAG: zinc finger domain-containing protein [Promethearchaeota archaeon]
MDELVSFVQRKCTSCGKLVTPYENTVKFNCPSCTSFEITRCERCRANGTPYECLKCGFTGPL